tara:strand:+ start:1265 stop:1918 length:654 start_codon:yes stop_codon:yes gene_type:complete
MSKIVHQIFIPFKEGVLLNNIPEFLQHTKATIRWCEKYDIEYKMWSLTEVDELLAKYGYLELCNSFPQKVMKVDFVRYLIIYEYGGIYLDCDVSPMRSMDSLWLKSCWFSSWFSDKKDLPYIAIFGGQPKNDIFLKIVKHSIESYESKKEMEIYTKWKGRFVFQVTGHYMVQRVIKKNPNEIEILKCVSVFNNIKHINDFPDDYKAIFYDANISSWY